MVNSGIYAILNTVNDKCYIGSAVNIKERWRHHKRNLDRNCHFNRHLQASWNKYGPNIFIFTVMQYSDSVELIKLEQYWIDTVKPKYNLCKVAGSTLGITFKHRVKRISKPHTEERKAKISEKMKNFRHTEETKAKITKSKMGKVQSQETREKIRLAAKKQWERQHHFELKGNPLIVD